MPMRGSRADHQINCKKMAFDLWNITLEDTLIPGAILTAEEHLVIFRGRYNLPSIYLMKIWKSHNFILDSQTSWDLKLDIYESKEPNDKEGII